MANRSRFAGLYNAGDFNYGGVGLSVPAALQVNVGSTVTGTTSVTLAYGQCGMSDGTNLVPLNTNAPITIGVGSNAETVTPSAVSNPSPGIYGSPMVTASFANTHGIGDPISSGTFGLQEAVNFAAALGGGTVIVDAAWVSIGGTSAILAAAQSALPNTVTIWDNRTGNTGSVRTADITLTNAQILGMEATPVLVVPAQGAGTLIDVQDVTLVNLNTGVAYANGGAIQLSYGASLTYPASATVAATFLTSPTATEIVKAAGAVAATPGVDNLNVGIYITNATAPFITGTGTMVVRVNYSVLTGL